MDAAEVIKNLAQSHIVQSEISMQMQLGLPYLEKRNGRLCISFKPHREKYDNGNIEVFAQQYEISWAYPFAHIASYRNLSLCRSMDVSHPIAVISGRKMLSAGKYAIGELYRECSRVLSFQEKEGGVSDVMVKNYQKKYRQTAEMLGLSVLYCQEEE